MEPFAGAAGYSLRYADRRVILVEKNPVVAGLWRWLLRVPAREIRAIPCVDHLDDLPGWVGPEARWLVGFAFNDGTVLPRKSLSAGNARWRAQGRKFRGWTDARRERLAAQLGLIRHWRVIEGDYTAAPDVVATWFIDPPYQQKGHHYPHHLAAAEYPALGRWCRARRGQVIVCEAEGARWLPFRPFRTLRSGPTRQTHAEVIWTRPPGPHGPGSGTSPAPRPGSNLDPSSRAASRGAGLSNPPPGPPRNRAPRA